MMEGMFIIGKSESKVREAGTSERVQSRHDQTELGHIRGGRDRGESEQKARRVKSK